MHRPKYSDTVLENCSALVRPNKTLAEFFFFAFFCWFCFCFLNSDIPGRVLQVWCITAVLTPNQAMSSAVVQWPTLSKMYFIYFHNRIQFGRAYWVSLLQPLLKQSSVQDHTQAAPEDTQAKTPQPLCGNLCQWSISLTAQKSFPVFRGNLLSSCLCPLHLVLTMGTIEKSLAPPFLQSSCIYRHWWNMPKITLL